MSDNQLQIVVQESGLSPAKAQVILEQFQDYFALAAEWEKKAKEIIVTNASQTADMKIARVGRLLLKDKRVAIEKVRKELKEQALREGKAIDGIANILKALIVPIEEYLDRQEHFVELEAKAEEDARRAEEARKVEEERIAQEQADAMAREAIRLDNERLRKEAEERDKKDAELRSQQDRALAAVRKKYEETLSAEKARADQSERERLEAEQNAACLAAILTCEVECPFCHKRFVPPTQN